MVKIIINDILSYERSSISKTIFIILNYKIFINKNIYINILNYNIDKIFDFIRKNDNFIDLLLKENFILRINLIIDIDNIINKKIYIYNNDDKYFINYFFNGNNNIIKSIKIDNLNNCKIFINKLKIKKIPNNYLNNTNFYIYK